MQTTTSEVKNIQNRISNSWDIAENMISVLEDMTIETIQNETHSEKIFLNKRGIIELWNNIKWPQYM